MLVAGWRFIERGWRVRDRPVEVVAPRGASRRAAGRADSAGPALAPSVVSPASTRPRSASPFNVDAALFNVDAGLRISILHQGLDLEAPGAMQ